MKILIAAFILSLGSLGFATEQRKDVLTVGEGYYYIRETPLNQLYDQKELSSILKLEFCSGSWRGYKADWEIKDGVLWLKHIQKNPCSNTFQRVEANTLFQGKEYPIKASWYTGKIILPIAETKDVMREGFDPTNLKDEDFIGYDLEAFAFNFVNGQLVSKGVELIQVRY